MEELPKPPTPSPQDKETQAPAQPPKDPIVQTYDAYQGVAETVGGVPSFNWFDNLLQVAIIIAGVPLAMLVGYLIGGPGGMGAGCLLGFVCFGLLGGAVVMVLGMMRSAKRRKERAP